MTKVTPKTIGEFLLKNWKNIFLIIFVLIFVYQCSGNRDLELANSTLKKQAEAHLENAKMFEQKNIALQKDFEKLSDSVLALKENEKKIIASRVVIKEKLIEKTNQIRNYNSSQIALHTQERYSVDSTKVKTTIDGTAIKDDVMIDVLTELEEGDACVEEVKNLESQIEVKNEIKKKQEEQVANLSMQIDNANCEKEEFKLANELTKTALENAESALQKKKNGNNFWKITTFAIVVSAITKGIIDNK